MRVWTFEYVVTANQVPENNVKTSFISQKNYTFFFFFFFFFKSKKDIFFLKHAPKSLLRAILHNRKEHKHNYRRCYKFQIQNI